MDLASEVGLVRKTNAGRDQNTPRPIGCTVACMQRLCKVEACVLKRMRKNAHVGNKGDVQHFRNRGELGEISCEFRKHGAKR